MTSADSQSFCQINHAVVRINGRLYCEKCLKGVNQEKTKIDGMPIVEYKFNMKIRLIIFTKPWVMRSGLSAYRFIWRDRTIPGKGCPKGLSDEQAVSVVHCGHYRFNLVRKHGLVIGLPTRILRRIRDRLGRRTQCSLRTDSCSEHRTCRSFRTRLILLRSHC